MINKTIDRVNSKSFQKKTFETSWSITYRKPNYDALGDPHASYYFLNQSMKKHLTSLRKSIDKEGSFVEKKKIRGMITERMKDYDNDKKVSKIDAYYFKMKSSPSISSLGSYQSKKYLGKFGNLEKSSELIANAEKDLVIQSQREASKTLEPKKQSHTIEQPDPIKRRKDTKVGLPRISIQSQASSKVQKASLQEFKKQLVQEQESKVTMFNKTEHNKFLRYLMEKKKKLNIPKEPDVRKLQSKDVSVEKQS